MATNTDLHSLPFHEQARRILDLPVDQHVNALGGYGPNGEVIYHAHPINCPSVLVDSQSNATATFMSNGSTGLTVELAGGFQVRVLDGHFDTNEKREIGVPSQNVWLDVAVDGDRQIASLINPRSIPGCRVEKIKIVKLGDPQRAMWYGAWFKPTADTAYETAVRCALTYTPHGPALTRCVYLRNTGKTKLTGRLWTYFNLHGTQRFVYNKELWYDNGLPVTPTELVVAATVPYSNILQIKRVSSQSSRLTAEQATCDYGTFVGDTSVSCTMPEAVRTGAMLKGGAGSRLNHFSTAAIAANQFSLTLAAGQDAWLEQSLLYLMDEDITEQFRDRFACDEPSYIAMARAFQSAAELLISGTPDASEIIETARSSTQKEHTPYFELRLPHQRTAAEYANSVWTGVKELYENCRAHGATLANGIELGTRDRGQDMWPKMKEDPGRVRADLVHAMSFMYVTDDKPPDNSKPLTLPQKLYGLFPRQFPSRWDDRRQEVANDNRPYADSPLWLINSAARYIRETGDVSILSETVKSIRLTDPDHPETSSIVGCDRTFTVLEVILEVFASFERLVNDTPYGMAQILYGDWCDPIDMFGTSVVGDDKTRGRGRGVQVRLSAHLFQCLVEMIDILDVPSHRKKLTNADLPNRVEHLRQLAGRLRENIVKWAWEQRDEQCMPGFISVIHELKADGSTPNYEQGETGYTLGSMRGTDFDGIRRRDLAANAFCLHMLNTRRDYLKPVEDTERMIAELLETTSELFFDPKLGLVMFSTPFANNRNCLARVGRMGIVPTGCAENGEYHHCQVFMHRFRLDLPDQVDTVWQQFKPIMSAMRDESIWGPFESPTTSYASDKDDPHFGKGMYFGLSGSVDWIVEVLQGIVGLQLALHDERVPSVRIEPNLPAEIRDALEFRRIVHYALPKGGYRQIPLTVCIARQGEGDTRRETRVKINGRQAAKAEVADLADVDRLSIEITYVYG